MNVQRRASSIFVTTHWTQVLEAANPVNDSGHSSFAALYQTYWFPLYAYCRRRGLTPADGEDVVQDFFVHLVERQSLAGLEREGGKFRSYLLKCLDNFLLSCRRRDQAQKRGGGCPPLSIDVEQGETLISAEMTAGGTPQSEFERRWAYALLDNVTKELRAEYSQAGKSDLFERLVPYLQPTRSGVAYATVAAECGMSEGAIKVAVHRMRHRYGDLLRAAVGCTVATPAEIDDEVRHLIQALG